VIPENSLVREGLAPKSVLGLEGSRDKYERQGGTLTMRVCFAPEAEKGSENTGATYLLFDLKRGAGKKKK